MEKLVVKGGKRLCGEVTISGAKNAAVAIIPAALLVDGICIVENVPAIRDVEVICSILEELGAEDKPRIYVYNKADKLSQEEIPFIKDNSVLVSAKTGKGIDELLGKIESILKESKKEYVLLIPYDSQSKINLIYKEYTVLETEYSDNGIFVKCILDEKGRGMYKAYITDADGEQ